MGAASDRTFDGDRMPEEQKQPSVGDAIKDTQTGKLPVGTVEQILEAAPKDLTEDICEVPEWGFSVRIRSSSAAQQSLIKEEGFVFEGENTRVNWAEMDIKAFQMGVIEPVFSEEEVRRLHLSSGPGFNRVLNALNDINNISKEAVEKVKERFPGGREA